MLRTLLATTLLASAASVAHAQPGDPYGPTQAPPLTPPSGPASATPPTPPADPVLAHQVSQAIVERAQELFDAKLFLDAKQLATEAIVISPQGSSADHARMIVKLVNQQLGIKDDAERPIDNATTNDPYKDPTASPIPPKPPADEGGPTPRTAAMVHGAVFGGVLGAMLGTVLSDDDEGQAAGALLGGIGGGIGGGYLGIKLAERLAWNEAQIRTVGSGGTWGAAIGAFIGDIGTGLEGTSFRQILISAGVGSIVGSLAGAGLASKDNYTRGDLALVDTFAGMGAVGGLTLGMVMQPVESEAYSLNAAVGTAGGVVVGLLAAPETNTTQRRMLRVAGASALGGLIPFLLYAAISDDTINDDEQAIGFLSTSGLVLGAYLGFRWTRGMDDGKDVKTDENAEKDDAPPAAVMRDSAGHWRLGSIVPRALSRTLDDRQRGTTFTLLGGSF